MKKNSSSNHGRVDRRVQTTCASKSERMSQMKPQKNKRGEEGSALIAQLTVVQRFSHIGPKYMRTAFLWCVFSRVSERAPHACKWNKTNMCEPICNMWRNFGVVENL